MTKLLILSEIFQTDVSKTLEINQRTATKSQLIFTIKVKLEQINI